jgi:hypothetical protein
MMLWHAIRATYTLAVLFLFHRNDPEPKSWNQISGMRRDLQ